MGASLIDKSYFWRILSSFSGVKKDKNFTVTVASNLRDTKRKSEKMLWMSNRCYVHVLVMLVLERPPRFFYREGGKTAIFRKIFNEILNRRLTVTQQEGLWEMWKIVNYRPSAYIPTKFYVG